MTDEQISAIMWLFTTANLTPDQVAERDRLIAALMDLRKRAEGKERYR